MLEKDDDDRPVAPALASAPYFGDLEPVSDIPSASGDLYLALARTIEREVIPRLLVNARADVARGDALRAQIDVRRTQEVASFCQIILTGELSTATDVVARELAAGRTSESLLVELFAPTARRLGALWEIDECSFLDVTIALGRLQQLLRLFSETYRAAPDDKKLGFCALLATLPQNQHVFGIFVVEQLFRRAGWNVLCMPAPQRVELLETVAHEWFSIVGLSIGCDVDVSLAAALIADIRHASMNRRVLVLVGGQHIDAHPEKAELMGADLAGADAQQAIARSEIFLRSIGR